MIKINSAVLIIHGFAGGTYDEEDLANYLELNPFLDVYQFTLPGHKKNLSNVEYTEWIEYSEEKLKWLIDKGYKRIYLIGHSLGGVIATYLATKYREIKKLILAAPAFHYLNFTNGEINIKNTIKLAPQIVKTYGGSELLSRFLKLNVKATKEFTNLIKNYYEFPKKIKCQLLILQGTNDDVVPISSSQYVYDSALSKTKKLVLIDGVTHDIFCSEREEIIFATVKSFIKNIRPDSGIYNI